MVQIIHSADISPTDEEFDNQFGEESWPDEMSDQEDHQEQAPSSCM